MQKICFYTWKITIFIKNLWYVFYNLNNINIILVPLLAFDKNGHRVGYGGGYYDKFMIHYPKSIKIGLSLEEPIQILDINNHDIKLNFCITPKKLYKFD